MDVRKHYMKTLSIAISICFLLAFDSVGQQVRGKILINGQEFKSNKDTSTYFTFKPLKAKLSRQGRRYLDNVATHIINNHLENDSLRIIISPALTFKEQKVVNNQIRFARGLSVRDYLKENYGIEIRRLMIRETVRVCELTGEINRTRDNKKQ